MPDFPARLRRYRISLRISQQTLAERCGISWADQKAYEAGTLVPNADYLYALADAGIRVEYLTTAQRPRQWPEGMSMVEFALLQNFEAASPVPKCRSAEDAESIG